MTCEEALLAISAALDGELPPRERARLSEHLVACESCRELAEDLRVLTDALEDSGREPPAGLAESVRRAVAETPQAVPDRKKRRPPYLRSLAAMVALCVGLGGIGLFISGQGGGKAGSSAGEKAAVRFQAAPGATEKSAGGCGGLNDDAGYSAAEGGDPAEAPMEAANEEAPQLAPVGAPMPSSAPAPQAAAGTYNYGGGTEENTPNSGSDGGGPTSDSAGSGSDHMEGNEKPALTPGEPVSSPEEAEELARKFYAGSGEEPDLWTFTWLGLSPNGRYYLFEVCRADSGDYRTMLAVPLEGGQVLDKQDAAYQAAVEQ